MLTLIGFHTFTMYYMFTFDEIIGLLNDFIHYCKTNNNLRIYPNGEPRIMTLPNGTSRIVGPDWETKYLGRNMGVKWKFKLLYPQPRYKGYRVEVEINPQFLLGNDDYCAISSESHLPGTVKEYNSFAKKISPNLPKFADYTMNRVDYCGNFDGEEMELPCTPEQLLELQKQAFIPFHYTEKKIESRTSKRMVSYKNSFYLESDSITINIYRKQAELKENHPNRLDDIKRAENLSRFEIQYGGHMMYHLKREINDGMKPWEQHDFAVTKRLLSDGVAKAVISKYFKKMLMTNDYITFQETIEKIESCGFRQPRRDRLINALRLVKKHGGIENAKQYLKENMGNVAEFLDTVKELDGLGINPVTIPRRWNIPFIPNLLKVYEGMVGNGIIK